MKKIKIPKELYKEIIEYCNFNNIIDIENEIISIIKKGFNLIKYGSSPLFLKQSKNLDKIEEDIVKKDIVNEPKEENPIIEKEIIQPIKKEEKKKIKKGITIIKNN